MVNSVRISYYNKLRLEPLLPACTVRSNFVGVVENESILYSTVLVHCGALCHTQHKIEIVLSVIRIPLLNALKLPNTVR